MNIPFRQTKVYIAQGSHLFASQSGVPALKLLLCVCLQIVCSAEVKYQREEYYIQKLFTEKERLD